MKKITAKLIIILSALANISSYAEVVYKPSQAAPYTSDKYWQDIYLEPHEYCHRDHLANLQASEPQLRPFDWSTMAQHSDGNFYSLSINSLSIVGPYNSANAERKYYSLGYSISAWSPGIGCQEWRHIESPYLGDRLRSAGISFYTDTEGLKDMLIIDGFSMKSRNHNPQAVFEVEYKAPTDEQAKASLEMYYLHNNGAWVKVKTLPLTDQSGHSVSEYGRTWRNVSGYINLPYETLVQLRLKMDAPKVEGIDPVHTAISSGFGLNSVHLLVENCVPDLINGGCL